MIPELSAALIEINKKARPRNKHHHKEFNDEYLRELAKYDFVFLKDQHKSRLKISRGGYYTYEDALDVINLLESSYGKLPFITTNDNPSSQQWWRQALAFVRENLDPQSRYENMGKYIIPKFEAGRLKLYPRRNVAEHTGVMQNNVEFSTIAEWLDTAETGDVFLVNGLTDEDIEALKHLANYNGERLTRL